MPCLAHASFTRLHNLDNLPEDWFEPIDPCRQITLRCGSVVDSLADVADCAMARNCEYADECHCLEVKPR